MGGSGTHELTGVFSEGEGNCGYPTSFTDHSFIASLEGNTLTLRQTTTGDVNTGIINPDGSFEIMRADGHESYKGKFNSDWSGEAINVYIDSDDCETKYKVVFKPRN